MTSEEPSTAQVLDLGRDGKYTLDEFMAAYDGRHDNWSMYDKFVRAETLHFLEKLGRSKTPETASMATSLYQNRALALLASTGHNCYGNDMFYLAHRYALGFDMSRASLEKKRSAVIVVWNGRHMYFEWLTHGGFDNAELFADMGLISPAEADRYRAIAKDPGSGMYCFLDKPVEERLIAKLRLTESEIESAHLLSHCVWEKEHENNKNSGQYNRLRLRPDVGHETEYA